MCRSLDVISSIRAQAAAAAAAAARVAVKGFNRRTRQDQ